MINCMDFLSPVSVSVCVCVTVSTLIPEKLFKLL